MPGLLSQTQNHNPLMMFSGGLTNPKPHINPKNPALSQVHHPFENPLEPSYHNLVTNQLCKCLSTIGKQVANGSKWFPCVQLDPQVNCIWSSSQEGREAWLKGQHMVNHSQCMVNHSYHHSQQVVNHHNGLTRGQEWNEKKTSVFLSKHHPSCMMLLLL